MCYYCKDEGYVFATRKNSLASEYAFLCDCPRGDAKYSKSVTRWNKNFERDFVPRYIDKPLTDQWISDMIKNEKTDDPEFQKRMKIWGRQRFEDAWKRFKNEQGEKAQREGTSSMRGRSEDDDPQSPL